MNKQYEYKKLKILYGEIGKKDRGCVPLRWKEWERGLEESSESCYHLQISYNRIRKDLRARYDAELLFQMVDPVAYLQTTLIDWYRRGARRDAFAFYRTLREQVDYLGLESSISVRTFADWLKAQNPIPLYNPQIGFIDSSKRLEMVSKLLREDFDLVTTAKNHEELEKKEDGSSPFSRIDLREHWEYFEFLVQKDQEIYQKIESGKIVKQEQGDKKKGEKKIMGRVVNITEHRLHGFVVIREGKVETRHLVLQVNGKILRRKKLSVEQRKENGRIPFLFRKLSLNGEDRIEVIVKPDNESLRLSQKAKEFFGEKRMKKEALE